MLNHTTYKLQDAMMETVSMATGDADVILLVTDVYGTILSNEKMMSK